MSLVGRSFLHASDIHFGFPLGALDGCRQLDATMRAELVEQMQGAFDNLIDLAIREDVLFVVLAGDLYDSAEAQDNQQGRFRSGLVRLADHGIRVFMVHGNHDPLRSSFRPRRPLPDNVHIFNADTPHEFEVPAGDEQVHVAGVSFGSRSVPENLAQRFHSLPREHARWRVGVLHTSLAGSAEHDPYAPCSVDDLRNAPVGYWALGHIHLRSDRNSLGPGRWWAYPGNLQGRSFKPAECHPKGALLVRLAHDGFEAPEFRACDTVRFASVDIDISEAGGVEESYELAADALAQHASAADGRRLVARVRLVGRHAQHAEFRRLASAGSYLDNLLDSFHDELGTTVVAGAVSEVRPAVDPAEIRKGESLLATALQRLDQLSDDELLALATSNVARTAAEVLRKPGVSVERLRLVAERALIEAIHDEGAARQ